MTSLGEVEPLRPSEVVLPAAAGRHSETVRLWGHLSVSVASFSFSRIAEGAPGANQEPLPSPDSRAGQQKAKNNRGSRRVDRHAKRARGRGVRFWALSPSSEDARHEGRAPPLWAGVEL